VDGGEKIFGVFCVKNHDFTPKNHIFSNFRGAPPLDPLLVLKVSTYYYYTYYIKIAMILGSDNVGLDIQSCHYSIYIDKKGRVIVIQIHDVHKFQE
jgi:hypothetical protein